jgi:hypothetical protein
MNESGPVGGTMMSFPSRAKKADDEGVMQPFSALSFDTGLINPSPKNPVFHRLAETT